MRQKTERFQTVKFLIWTLIALNILLIVMPANAMSVVQIREIIVEEAAETGVPVSLVMAVVKTESNFRSDHEGKDGARGLMQILPTTAESLGLDPRSLWKARPNIKTGLEILGGLLQRTDGDWQETLQAYGSHRRDLNSVKNQRYVTAVLKSERQFAEQFAATDDILDRRREVLAGHDDWGTSDQPTTNSQYLDDDTEPAMARNEYDAWLDETDNARTEYTIHQETESPEIEIVIYETHSEPEVIWIPAPRPEYFEPRRFSRKNTRFERRFARNFSGQRRPGPNRFRRNGGLR